MCERAVENESYNLKFVPDHFKTHEMCEKAVKGDPYSLQHVPDWFATRELVTMCYDNIEYQDDDVWYDGYKKRKIQKASIKEDLAPIAWHPSRWWD